MPLLSTALERDHDIFSLDPATVVAQKYELTAVCAVVVGSAVYRLA
jgi:hypothetical protein